MLAVQFPCWHSSYVKLFSFNCDRYYFYNLSVDAFAANEETENVQQALDLMYAEIVFDFVAFFLFVACGVINVIYDERPFQLIKGSLSILNGICFFLDAVICNQCQYRWGQQLESEYVQRMNEQRAFFRLSYTTRNRYL